MLRGAHEYRVAALDTGGVTTAAQAEIILDERNTLVQAEGWHCNREYDVTIETADTTKVAVAIAGDGDWDASAKTITSVAAFADYTWASGDQISVTAGTGVTVAWYEIASKTSDDVIVLKEEIAAADTDDVATDIIGWEDALVAGSDVLRLDSYNSTIDVVLRNGMLFDRDDNTFSFDDEMTVTLVRELDFTHISEYLQNLIAADAAVEFQNFLIQGTGMDATLRVAAAQARMRARQEEQRVAQVNILETAHAYRIRGESGVNYPVRR